MTEQCKEVRAAVCRQIIHVVERSIARDDEPFDLRVIQPPVVAGDRVYEPVRRESTIEITQGNIRYRGLLHKLFAEAPALEGHTVSTVTFTEEKFITEGIPEPRGRFCDKYAISLGMSSLQTGPFDMIAFTSQLRTYDAQKDKFCNLADPVLAHIINSYENVAEGNNPDMALYRLWRGGGPEISERERLTVLQGRLAVLADIIDD